MVYVELLLNGLKTTNKFSYEITISEITIIQESSLSLVLLFVLITPWA